MIYLATCCHVKPWATVLANLADVFLNMGLMLQDAYWDAFAFLSVSRTPMPSKASFPTKKTL